MLASKSHRHDGNDFVNRWDFRCQRNDDRVDAAVTVGGRLFQALVPVAEKDRSPSVDLRVAGTTSADELEDLRCCRDSNCATCCNCSERYAGARLCLHLLMLYRYRGRHEQWEPWYCRVGRGNERVVRRHAGPVTQWRSVMSRDR